MCAGSACALFISGVKIMLEINKRVQRIRKSKKFTQEDLAKILGTKTSTYSQMERSGKIPCETLIKISEVLNTDIRYFLYGDEFDDNQKKETVQPEKIIIYQKEEPQEDYTFTDENERYLLLTYRNLRPDEQGEAYRLFMEHFNLKTINEKRRQKRKEQKELKTKLN